LIEALKQNLQYQKDIERNQIIEIGLTRDKIRKLIKKIEEYNDRQRELPYWQARRENEVPT
jgi:hypothetical protein